ncbi:PC4-domain-containing protein [Polychaeton citri CBS 116435]|uniref:PC4-domain-containing protein n=1 Tax=Polychaeton citri CBS 116435 TaxID=1314669 RepID=A0A9P4QG97_9PEZI|nr:PC4-domain-containing protein [Polychaeton citri CBS 116435]
MPKGSTKKRVADDYESDDGFVEDAPKSKKTKNVSGGGQVDDEGNPYWELSRQRRVQVTEFRGAAMVNIREFYEKDGKSLPGKKGIALSVDQYATLLQLLPEIEKALEDKGKTVPRPNYSDAATANNKDDEENEASDSDAGVARAGGNSKANYEGTSEEDDE